MRCVVYYRHLCIFARYRWAVPTPNACTGGLYSPPMHIRSVSLPCCHCEYRMSLRGAKPRGNPYSQCVPGWSVFATHEYSLGIDTKAPLCKGGCRAISAAGGLSQPTSLHMLVSAQNNPSAPAGHLPLHRGGFFARFRYMHVIARSRSDRGNPLRFCGAFKKAVIASRLKTGVAIRTPYACPGSLYSPRHPAQPSNDTERIIMRGDNRPHSTRIGCGRCPPDCHTT